MPIRRIPGTDTDYYLVIFDEDGEETKESDGRLLSDALVLAAASATDVFLASHGWKGDVPAAIEQYDAWFGAALKLQEDRDAARRVDRDVKAVHRDITALLNAGVLDRAPGGGVVFPYDAVKVEFLFRAR